MNLTIKIASVFVGDFVVTAFLTRKKIAKIFVALHPLVRSILYQGRVNVGFLISLRLLTRSKFVLVPAFRLKSIGVLIFGGRSERTRTDAGKKREKSPRFKKFGWRIAVFLCY